MRRNRVLVVIAMMLFTMMIFLPSYQASPKLESRNDTIIALESLNIVINESKSTTIEILNATDLIIAKLNITWDPTIISLNQVDSSSSDFDMVLSNNTNESHLKITSYKFGPGLNGNVTICDLEFEPAPNAEIGDWCWMNIFNTTLWNSTFKEIPHSLENGTANIILPTDSIFVDDDFNSSNPGWQTTHFNIIQDGIDAVDENGTVYVHNGTYYEHLIINKSINIIGQHKQDTIIDGSGFEHVVNISKYYVTISNLSMKNGEESIIKYHNTSRCLLSHCNILPNATYGVWCYHSENISINNNSFSSKGIHLTGETLNEYFHTINDNTVNGKDLHYHKNKNTFILDSQNIGQLILVNCTNTEIKNSTINNTDFGIELHYNNNTTIDECNISNNYINIGIYSSTDITISHSTIDNSRYGIYVCESNFSYIKSNIITNHNHGVLLRSSTNATIQSNSFAYNGHGIQTVPIQPFFISKAKIMHNDFSNNLYHDITLWFNHENIVKHNNCSKSNFGIYLSRSDRNLIMDNHIQLCDDDGMVIAHSHNNTIEKNGITNYDQDGINIVNSYNNSLSNSYISNGEIGIHCTDSINNLIINNTVSNNEIGINVDIYDDYCHNNTFYHNNFIDNLMNVNDECINSWDNGYPSGGNYYDDYHGPDSDGDGIGETPYNITGGSNQDVYPFIEQDGWLKTIDVNQHIFERGFPIRHTLDGNWAAAQSFKTNNNSLTRVDVYLRKFGIPEFNLTLDIREDGPEGNLIESFEFSLEEVDVNWRWFILDMVDINTSVNIEYFIVIPPAQSGVTTSFGYEWGFSFGDIYPDGSFWFTRDGGNLWRDLPTMYEFCFRTYGYS